LLDKSENNPKVTIIDFGTAATYEPTKAMN
jgi:hypothetical protein